MKLKDLKNATILIELFIVFYTIYMKFTKYEKAINYLIIIHHEVYLPDQLSSGAWRS